MHSLWNFFLTRRAFTIMLIWALVLVGIGTIVAIPKESAPEVIIPIGIVTTTLRGASAEDMEKLVTNKLEQSIANVDNIDKVTSNSIDGVSVISAQFLAKANVEKSIQDLKDAVDKAKKDLPSEVDTPTVSKVNFADQPILIVSVSQDLAGKEITNLSNDLEREIKKVAGVSSIDISGVRKREIEVIIQKDKIAKYGLSLSQVVAAIQSANASAPVGKITVADVDYPIKFSGSIDEAAQVPDISLQTNTGTLVYLRDVAFISDGLAAPKTYSRISVNGQPSENSITLYIHKKSGGDITTITTAVRNKIEELKLGILNGANVVVSVDKGKDVQRDLRELSRTGLETVILVMLILLLTIGWRESVVAGLSIPLSFVIAFIGIYLSGNTINFLSLFSLILAIGILVDSGIVVAEAIHTRLKTFGTVEESALASIKEYAWPLIAGTMTTVAVFFPLFFLSGIVGQFVKSIPFTIIFVLIASIFVALGMVPILATILSSDKHEENWFTNKQEEYFLKAKNWYQKFLGAILANKKSQNWFFVSLGAGFVLSICLIVFGLLKVEIFPQDDQTFVVVSVEQREGTPLAQTDLLVRQIEEVLYSEKFVTSFVTTVGEPSSLLGATGANTKTANITVIIGDKTSRKITSTQIVDRLRKDLSPLNTGNIKVGQGNNGPSSGKPVVIKFIGDDLNVLGAAADKSEKILNEIKGTQDVETSERSNGTEIEISIDRDKATENGLTTAQVAQILRTSVAGLAATTIKKQDADIEILVKVDLNENFVLPEDTTKTTIESIKNLPIATQKGSILLGSIINFSTKENRPTISHEKQKRIVSVGSNLKTGTTATEVVTAFKKRAKELNLPKEVTVDYGGETADVDNTFRDMLLALLGGMTLMLAILVLTFNSFRYSFYLLLAIPLSLIGVLGGLTITGKSLSFSAMLGLIALAGVIINHSIIMLDSIIHRLDHEKSLGNKNVLFDVIIESSAIRLRPIVLTTLTTVVGMIPLAGVSALWGPLAISIMFGLAFAMVLTLVLIPLLFYRFPGKRYIGMK